MNDKQIKRKETDKANNRLFSSEVWTGQPEPIFADCSDGRWIRRWGTRAGRPDWSNWDWVCSKEDAEKADAS